MMIEQLSLFSANYDDVVTPKFYCDEIKLLSYVGFKQWLDEKFPFFKYEEEKIPQFKYANETFRFIYECKKGQIVLRNFRHSDNGDQHISIHYQSKRKDYYGWGTWTTTLTELEERINYALEEMNEK